MPNNDLISRSALLEQISVELERLETDNDRLWEINRKYHAGMAIVNGIVINAPAVDAVEVVRCKDCKAFGKSPWGHFRMGWCMIHGCHHGQDYYCASGKRRDAEVEG